MNKPPSFLPPASVVWLYLRFSSDNQSIESQENAMRAWCEQNQIVIARTFRDEARTGSTTAGRDDFMRLFQLVTADKPPAPKPAAVLIWSWSRFAREMSDAEYFKWGIRRTGVHVWSVTDNVPEGEFAPIIESLTHYQDAKFLERLKQDTTRGLHDLARQGFSSGGFPPVGYKRGESVAIGKKKNGETRFAHKWEFDPETQERVKCAWQMRLDGKSFWDIHAATRLMSNARGYTDFFRRVTYAGAIKCGATIVWDAHPAYVTRSEWERVNAQNLTRRANASQRENHPARKRGESPYLLSGILRCGFCGWAMVGSLYGREPYYRCDWRHRQGHDRVECKQPSLVAHALHSQVLQLLTREILTYDEFVSARDEFNAMLSGNAAPLRERIAYLQCEQKRLKVAIANLVASLEKLGPVAEIADKLTARRGEFAVVSAELDDLSAQLAAGEQRIDDAALRVLASELPDYLEFADALAIKPIIQTTIVRASLYLDEIEVAYNPLALLTQQKTSAKSALAHTCNYSVPLTGNGLNTGLRIKRFPIVRPGKGHRPIIIASSQ